MHRIPNRLPPNRSFRRVDEKDKDISRQADRDTCPGKVIERVVLWHIGHSVDGSNEGQRQEAARLLFPIPNDRAM